MKKLIAVFLIIASVFACVACGTQEPDQHDFTLGKIEGPVYKNTFVGIGCTLDGDWMYMAEDRLEDFAGKGGEICAMYATENARSTVRLDYVPMDNSDIKDLDPVAYSKSYLYDMVSLLFMDPDKVSREYNDFSIQLSGKTLPGQVLTASQGQMNVSVAVVAIKCDGYIARICITSGSRQYIDQIAARFYTL